MSAEVTAAEILLIMEWIGQEPDADPAAVRKALRAVYWSQTGGPDLSQRTRNALNDLYQASLQEVLDRDVVRRAWAQYMHFVLRWTRWQSRLTRLAS